MPPMLALFACLAFILVLLVYDIRRCPNVSLTLFIPLIWVLISFSKPLSLWLNLGDAGTYATYEDVLEGSPFDRNVFIVLIALALLIIIHRKRDFSFSLRENGFILFYFLFGAASILWSDFALVSFKRYIKGFGNILIAVCILSEYDPSEAIKAIVRRSAYILIPLSVVLIKYFPDIGRYYHPWTGYAFNRGVGWDKNSIGYLCLICGFYFFWNYLSVLRQERSTQRSLDIGLHVLFIGMILWLLIKSNSATALVCLGLGGMVVLALKTDWLTRNIHLLSHPVFLIIFILGAAGISYVVFSDIVSLIGRDVTLTGRTELWGYLLEENINPLLGTGFESFWLGPRIEDIWNLYWWHPNQAHNGFLETYLNLGLIGVALLFGILMQSYRKAYADIVEDGALGRYKMGYWVIALLYNVTEAAFKGLHPVWFFFLLNSITIRRYDTELDSDGEEQD